ncbi:MAG: VOC family protein [Phenylobacterium sp.]|uniref:VOC family protein n=1 Tax=Phenylobacterium sp. TaxID=1871053 RepID=UPI00391DD656
MNGLRRMDRAAITPTAFYRDPMAALHWLERAFGFETVLLLTDDEGRVGHAEVAFRGCHIGIGGEWAGPQLGGAAMKSPASVGGAGTQFMWVELAEGIDDHCQQARAAGAKIVADPEDQFYGARTYRAHDLEGHVWNFRQELRHVSNAEMTAATGLKVRNRLQEV